MAKEVSKGRESVYEDGSSEEDIDPTPELVTTQVSEEYLKGVGKVGGDRLIVLLDLTKVLSREEFEKISG